MAGTSAAVPESAAEGYSTSEVLESIAGLADVAARPRLLGEEVIILLTGAGVIESAVLRERLDPGSADPF